MQPPVQTHLTVAPCTTPQDLPPLVIYIAGYGRSGSTALDIALGHQLGAISLGELSELGTEILRGPVVLCGCGNNYIECPLWGNIAKDAQHARRLRNARYPQAHPLAKLALCLMPHGDWQTPNESVLVDDILSPFRQVARHYPKAICIDSSKTAWLTARRPQALSRAGLNVVVIHIQRSLVGVLKSVQNGGNKKLAGIEPHNKRFRTLRALIAYFFANQSARALARNFPYLYIRQEEFLRSPNETLTKITNYITPFFQNGYTRYSEQHIVAGNRLKKSSPMPAD